MRKIVITILILIPILTSCNISSNSSGSYNRKGLNYYGEGMYAEAVENFQKAVEVNKNKAEYFINYGMALIETGDYDKAIEQFDNAIILKDTKITRENNKLAYRGKGIACLFQKEYTSAISQFDLALEINETRTIDEDILFYKAESESKGGDYDAAIETYSQIIGNNKNNARAYNYRADIYAIQGKTDLAEGDYNLAIANNKNNYNLYINKYFLLLNTGQDIKAQEVLNAALEINSKSIEDTLNMARIHFYQGDYSEAFIKLSVARESGYSEALFYLGSYYENEGDEDKAIEMYKEYVNNDKILEGSVAYNQLGILMMKKANYNEALEYIQKGIALKDESALQALKFNEIIAYEKLTLFNKALRKAKEYVKEYPEDEVMLKEYEFLRTRKQ